MVEGGDLAVGLLVVGAREQGYLILDTILHGVGCVVVVKLNVLVVVLEAGGRYKCKMAVGIDYVVSVQIKGQFDTGLDFFTVILVLAGCRVDLYGEVERMV